jgi:hypothetical protein
VTDSPAKVLYDLLLYLGLTTAQDSSVSRELQVPDDRVTVYDTEGRDLGREMSMGWRLEHRGFQIRVRSRDYATGYDRAQGIALALDAVYRTNGLHAVYRTSPVLYVGTDSPTNQRRIFTLNGLVALL